MVCNPLDGSHSRLRANGLGELRFVRHGCLFIVRTTNRFVCALLVEAGELLQTFSKNNDLSFQINLHWLLVTRAVRGRTDVRLVLATHLRRLLAPDRSHRCST